MHTTSVGIIGMGSFGSFAAEKLSKVAEIKAYDTKAAVDRKWSTDLAQVASCDYVLLCVPVSSYVSVLNSLKPLLGEKTIVVDISSVKIEPHRIFRQHMAKQPYVSLHPLFGPQSASDSLVGHDVVLCPELSSADALPGIVKCLSGLGLVVREMSADQHDKLMAELHALTFFVARGLDRIGVKPEEIMTPSYQKLVDLAELEKHHSDELFNTIQSSNPYAADVRRRLLDALRELDANV